MIEVSRTRNSGTKPTKAAEAFRAQAESMIQKSLGLVSDAKLRKLSAYQLVIIAGILRDKLRDLDAKPPTETQTLRFRDVSEMRAYLREAGTSSSPGAIPGPAAEPAPAAAEAEPGQDLGPIDTGLI
jgi:hypothetical protein